MRVRREVGDPPVVVVTEAAGAVAPVSDVVWFHLEVSIELPGDERTPGPEIPQSESLGRQAGVFPGSQHLSEAATVIERDEMIHYLVES